MIAETIVPIWEQLKIDWIGNKLWSFEIKVLKFHQKAEHPLVVTHLVSRKSWRQEITGLMFGWNFLTHPLSDRNPYWSVHFTGWSRVKWPTLAVTKYIIFFKILIFAENVNGMKRMIVLSKTTVKKLPGKKWVKKKNLKMHYKKIQGKSPVNKTLKNLPKDPPKGFKISEKTLKKYLSNLS